MCSRPANARRIPSRGSSSMIPKARARAEVGQCSPRPSIETSSSSMSKCPSAVAAAVSRRRGELGDGLMVARPPPSLSREVTRSTAGARGGRVSAIPRSPIQRSRSGTGALSQSNRSRTSRANSYPANQGRITGADLRRASASTPARGGPTARGPARGGDRRHVVGRDLPSWADAPSRSHRYGAPWTPDHGSPSDEGWRPRNSSRRPSPPPRGPPGAPGETRRGDKGIRSTRRVQRSAARARMRSISLVVRCSLSARTATTGRRTAVCAVVTRRVAARFARPVDGSLRPSPGSSGMPSPRRALCGRVARWCGTSFYPDLFVDPGDTPRLVPARRPSSRLQLGECQSAFMSSVAVANWRSSERRRRDRCALPGGCASPRRRSPPARPAWPRGARCWSAR